MLKDKKTRARRQANGADGYVEELLRQQEEMLKQILQKVQDHEEQLKELSKPEDFGGKSKLLATEIAYNPDEAHLSDMAVIVPRAVEPFALAKTLDAVLQDETQKGKSLTRVYMAEVKHLSRGLRGKGFELAALHARETEAPKGPASEFEQADLGRGL